MKKTLAVFYLVILFANASGQRLQLLQTDTVIYYIDTKSTDEVNWAPDIFDVNAYSITDGKANTDSIVLTIGPGNYAAYYCDTSQFENHSDWYLPSFQEAKDIYNLQYTIFPVTGLGYWTSTKVQSKYWAYTQQFGIAPDPTYVGTGMTRVLPYFCIRKERKITTGIAEVETVKDKKENYSLFDLNGKESPPKSNAILIKKYSDGRVEKVIYTD